MTLTTPRVLRCLALLAGLPGASSALAHAHLQEMSPAADAQVTSAPQVLKLHFSEGIELKFSGVTLSGPQTEVISTGAATVDGKGNSQFTVPVEQTLAQGQYTVAWHVVSVDGHKTQGQYHFSVK